MHCKSHNKFEHLHGAQQVKLAAQGISANIRLWPGWKSWQISISVTDSVLADHGKQYGAAKNDQRTKWKPNGNQGYVLKWIAPRLHEIHKIPYASRQAEQDERISQVLLELRSMRGGWTVTGRDSSSRWPSCVLHAPW
jgi:hypothetical protein